ncbi:SIR2 family protein [Schinkia sp. CFF1]
MNSTLLKSKMRKLIRPGNKPIFEEIKHVKIYKPHGSLSWFRLADNSFIKIPSISALQSNILKELGIRPVIVTPGIGKYLETHYEPYNNVMAEMQQSIQDAKAMIFLGFGFNDIHIQASFQSVLRNDSIPKLIATRSLSSTFFTLVEKNELKKFLCNRKV